MSVRFTCLVLIAAVAAGCSRTHRETREQMGTFVTITVHAGSTENAQRAAEAGFAAVENVDALMSTYKPDSDASRLNARDEQAPVRVSYATVRVLDRAARISKMTGGAFDITVRPLVELWRRAGKEKVLPTDEEIEAARALVNWDRGVLIDGRCDESGGPVLVKPRGAQIDLGGIAKGYAVDQAINSIRGQKSVTAALVDAGGDLYAFGSPPGRDHWIVGIQHPGSEEHILKSTLKLKDRAVATSGDYRQFFEIDGVRYSHIIDPRTGRPVEHMASVTVIALDATTADALATAISVLGPEDGLALAEATPDVETMILLRTEDGLETIRSSGYSRYEQE